MITFTKKPLAISAMMRNNNLVAAKSVTGPSIPFFREVQHASKNFLDTCVFFCACSLPVMAGRSGNLRVRRLLEAVMLARSTRHPEPSISTWWDLKPTFEETAHV